MADRDLSRYRIMASFGLNHANTTSTTSPSTHLKHALGLDLAGPELGRDVLLLLGGELHDDPHTRVGRPAVLLLPVTPLTPHQLVTGVHHLRLDDFTLGPPEIIEGVVGREHERLEGVDDEADDDHHHEHDVGETDVAAAVAEVRAAAVASTHAVLGVLLDPALGHALFHLRPLTSAEAASSAQTLVALRATLARLPLPLAHFFLYVDVRGSWGREDIVGIIM